MNKKPDLLVTGVSSKGTDYGPGKEIAKNVQSMNGTKILLRTKGLTVINGKFETLVEKFKLVLSNWSVKRCS